MDTQITAYNNAQEGERQKICELLAAEIHKALPDAENKLWHGAPVWFSNGNPIVGYAALKKDIQLLFWSGQSFDEPGLQPEGTYKAAQARYTDSSQININDLQRWIQKAQKIQWDYKHIVKNRGHLTML
jgi:hypothetical protein